MLRTILNLSLAAALLSAGPVGAQPAAQALRRAVALLDYVSGDYARAVGEHGELLSQAEHEEQVGFVQDAAKEVRADAPGAGDDLAARLDALAARVARRAPPGEVSGEARALRDEIARRFSVALLPRRAPDPGAGAAVYADSCASCHGAGGHPNPLLQLSTKPPDFGRADEVKGLSPQRAFNAATYGVPKTAMPAYDEALTDEQRWDVAFYVLSLAHPGPADGGFDLARAALAPTGYADLAALTDAQLEARLAAAKLTAEERATALAALRRGPWAEARPREARGFAEARRAVQQAVARAHAGERDAARRELVSAYLDHFEPFEAGIRARDPGLVRAIEGAFLSVRAAAEAGQQPAALDEAAARLDSLLERADTHGAGGGFVAFIAALAIALREGVEAALLVAAMLALLRKSGRERDAHAVHLGWASALAAGVATWWLSGALLVHLGGAQREWAEALLQLATAALLLYASHWILAAASARRLVSFLSQRTLQAGSSAVILGLTFVAVYREMFETVLFFRGLLLESPGQGFAVAIGAVAGLVALVGAVAAFQKLGRRLRPRPLLLACGFLLCVLAVLLVGNGVRSLQILGALPLTVWGAFQLPALGVYATREGLLAQAAVLAGLLGSAIFAAVRRPPGAPRPPAGGAAAPV